MEAESAAAVSAAEALEVEDFMGVDLLVVASLAVGAMGDSAGAGDLVEEVHVVAEDTDNALA